MVRFSLSPKITFRKEKTRKNSEGKESNIRLKRRIDTSHFFISFRYLLLRSKIFKLRHLSTAATVWIGNPPSA